MGASRDRLRCPFKGENGSKRPRETTQASAGLTRPNASICVWPRSLTPDGSRCSARVRVRALGRELRELHRAIRGEIGLEHAITGCGLTRVRAPAE